MVCPHLPSSNSWRALLSLPKVAIATRCGIAVVRSMFPRNAFAGNVLLRMQGAEEEEFEVFRLWHCGQNRMVG